MTNRVASCSCGELRLITSEEPLRISICHCLACQRRKGSVFGVQARFQERATQITGASSEYVRIGDEGSRATFHFCSQCGATVYYKLDACPEHIAVPVGAFADPGFPAPSFSVYEERMHPWVGLPADVEHMV
jgi:hypothetical protein